MKKMIIALALLSAFGVQAAETKVAPVNVSGYVDVQYGWSKTADTVTKEKINVYKGALYFSKEVEKTSFKLDLPFSMNGTANTNVSWVDAASTQAYIAHTFGMGLTLKAGQFDSLYGFEANDSADLAFARAGLLYNLMGLPAMHKGILATYAISPALSFSLLADNASPADLYGFQMAYAPENFSLTVGGYTQKVGTENMTTFDVIAGTKLGALALNAEADLKAYTDAVTGEKKNALGAMLLGIYSLSDALSAGARFEYLNTVAWTQGSMLKLTVGPQYALNSALTVKADLAYDKVSPNGVEAINGKSVALSAVYKF